MRSVSGILAIVVLLASAVTLIGCPSLVKSKDTAPSGLPDSTATPALRAASVIYVDFSYTGSDSNGTEARPYLNLTQAVNAAASGDTIRIKGGGSTTSSPETLRITKLSRIEASGGAVTVGDGSTNALVPNVVNMTQAAAQSAITAAGLATGAVSQQYHGTIPSGSVISQNPIAGRIVALGSAVALAVSKGQEPVVPAVTSFFVNNGAVSAVSRTVTLNNTCSGTPGQYMASESSSFAGATWQPYSTAPSFTLSPGNGIKTVYFKVKNATGASLPATDSIVLYEINGVSEETILLPGNVPLTIVWIAPGTFSMGAPPGEAGAQTIDMPSHTVTLTQGFWIGKYELAKGQWEAVMSTQPWEGHGGLDNPASPAVHVSWNDAQAFLTALNTATGLTFRLPTEAEWEYACRAGTATPYYWGVDADLTQIDGYAWWGDNAQNAGEAYAHISGQKLPNGWGLYDMSGNVWEWCQDWYSAYTALPVTDPSGPGAGSIKACRGGSWYNDDAYTCRSAARNFWAPDSLFDDFGFRVCRTASE